MCTFASIQNVCMCICVCARMRFLTSYSDFLKLHGHFLLPAEVYLY